MRRTTTPRMLNLIPDKMCILHSSDVAAGGSYERGPVSEIKRN